MFQKICFSNEEVKRICRKVLQYANYVTNQLTCRDVILRALIEFFLIEFYRIYRIYRICRRQFLVIFIFKMIKKRVGKTSVSVSVLYLFHQKSYD